MASTGSHIREQLRRAQQLEFAELHLLLLSRLLGFFQALPARLHDGLQATAQSFKLQEAAIRYVHKVVRIQTERTQIVDNETPVGPDSANKGWRRDDDNEEDNHSGDDNEDDHDSSGVDDDHGGGGGDEGDGGEGDDGDVM
ncbi:hypothetical protein EDB83DRAFT_2536561 [Lactarius deliciosus]|nr:hypothetical protein EDB83DRAFT_2536561 [Lactarius deliciosus]